MDFGRSQLRKLARFLLIFGFAGPLAAATKTVTLEVKGWTCGACASATRIALKKLEGVQEVSTDFEKSTAVVTYDDAKVVAEKMVRAVERIGYKAAVKGEASSSPPSPKGEARSEQLSGSVNLNPSRGSIPSDRLTFFEVPLECPAAPGLGCGGRARPILSELERDPKVAEAWLNHSGTLLAIVWKDPKDRGSGAKTVETIFRARSLEVIPAKGALLEAALKDFSFGGKWYRGAEVTRLSEEEAGVIASRLVRRVEKRVALSPDRAAALREDLAAAFKHLFAERSAGENVVLKKQELVDLARKNLDAEQLAEFEKALAKGIWRLPEDAG